MATADGGAAGREEFLTFTVPADYTVGEKVRILLNGKFAYITPLDYMTPGSTHDIRVPSSQFVALDTVCSRTDCYNGFTFVDMASGHKFCSDECRQLHTGVLSARSGRSDGTTPSSLQSIGVAGRSAAVANERRGVSATEASLSTDASLRALAGRPRQSASLARGSVSVLGREGMQQRAAAAAAANGATPPARPMGTHSERRAAIANSMQTLVATVAGKPSRGRSGGRATEAVGPDGVAGYHGITGSDGIERSQPEMYDLITTAVRDIAERHFGIHSAGASIVCGGAYNVNETAVQSISWAYDDEHLLRQYRCTTELPPGSVLPKNCDRILRIGLIAGSKKETLVRLANGGMKFSSGNSNGAHYRDIGSIKQFDSFLQDWRETQQGAIAQLRRDMVNGVDVDAKQCAIQHHERWITIADVFEAAIHKQYRLVEAPSISIADRLDRNDRLWKYVNIVLCCHHYTVQRRSPENPSVFMASWNKELYTSLDCYDISRYPRPTKREGYMDVWKEEQTALLRAIFSTATIATKTKKGKKAAKAAAGTEIVLGHGFNDVMGALRSTGSDLTANQRNALIRQLQSDGDDKGGNGGGDDNGGGGGRSRGRNRGRNRRGRGRNGDKNADKGRNGGGRGGDGGAANGDGANSGGGGDGGRDGEQPPRLSACPPLCTCA